MVMKEDMRTKLSKYTKIGNFGEPQVNVDYRFISWFIS